MVVTAGVQPDAVPPQAASTGCVIVTAMCEHDHRDVLERDKRSLFCSTARKVLAFSFSLAGLLMTTLRQVIAHKLFGGEFGT